MIVLAASAAFVGLVHSLAPGHWLPVVLMTRVKKWSVPQALFGAFVAASGHIIISVALGFLTSEVEHQFLVDREEIIESYSGLLLLVFGLIYAIWAYRTHHHCVGHSHHGPENRGGKAPLLFLFSAGFSPCVAALPVFAAAALVSKATLVMSVIAFSFGVLVALMGATVLVARGIMKLVHPILEHYGDVITGLGVALLGAVFFFFPM